MTMSVDCRGVPPLRLARRRVLAGGMLVGTLAVGGGALFWPRRGTGSDKGESHEWRFLEPNDRIALAALAPVFLGRDLWESDRAGAARALAIGVDQAISYLLQRTRDELRRLFDLLASPGGRWFLLRSFAAWEDSSSIALTPGIEHLRDADLDLLRTAYEGLRELILAVWYGDPAHWNAVAYPGTGDL